MFLSERWKKKVQDYEHKIQMLKLRNEVKKLEHKLFELCREHEEDKRAAHEQPLSFYSCHTLDHGSSNIVESSPIYDSYGMEEEHETPLVLFPHGQGLDGEGLLFNASMDSPNDIELIGEPVFDSYEQESGDVNLLNGITNDLAEPRGVDLTHDLLGTLIQGSASIMTKHSAFWLGEASLGAEHQHMDLCPPELGLISTKAAPNGLSRANSLLKSARQDPPVFWESFFAPSSKKSASKRSHQSRGHSLRNCYVFKRNGLHSVVIFRERADFKPGVHHSLVFELNSTPKSLSANTHSWTSVVFGAQTRSTQKLTKATSLKAPWVYGKGLLDFYIEDDELKDVEGLFLPHFASAMPIDSQDSRIKI